MAENISKARGLFDAVTDRVTDWIPKNLNAWLIALVCLIVLVALSRLMSLQKSVSELQSRPSVDEHLVRQVVRQHLEETVRAMDQQNRVQLQMRQQQMLEQARKAQQALLEKQKEASVPKIEILESVDPKKQVSPDAVQVPPNADVVPVVIDSAAPPPAPANPEVVVAPTAAIIDSHASSVVSHAESAAPSVNEPASIEQTIAPPPAPAEDSRLDTEAAPVAAAAPTRKRVKGKPLAV